MMAIITIDRRDLIGTQSLENKMCALRELIDIRDGYENVLASLTVI